MERIDDLQLKGLKIIQDTELFCFGTDAVLLADFAACRAARRVADLGTGTGILPLLIYGRRPEAQYFGIEIQSALAALARRSMELNGVSGSIQIFEGDIANAADILGGGFDAVVSNPPYEKANDGRARQGESHSIARKELLVNFDTLCKSAAAILKHGGWFYIIHKASRLPELMSTLKEHALEPKLMRLVSSGITAEPKYVLLGAVKGGREHMKLLPPLLLCGEDGGESEELKRIYGREGT